MNTLQPSEGQSSGWSKGSLGPHPAHLLFSAHPSSSSSSNKGSSSSTSVAALQATPHSTRSRPSLARPPSLSSLHLSLSLSLSFTSPPPSTSHASAALDITSATALLADSPLRVPPPPPSLRRASQFSATVGPCPTSPAASSFARAVTDWISLSFTALTTPTTTLDHPHSLALPPHHNSPIPPTFCHVFRGRSIAAR